MNRSEHRLRTEQFKNLQSAGRLLLPNAWDAASARVFEAAGFTAIGTTSAGIACARGLPDGQEISRYDMVREIASIVTAVSLPVTADIEGGYGVSPDDVAQTVEAVLDVGVVGVNLEDNTNRSSELPLFPIEVQTRRLAAARTAADRYGVPLVINARTDTFLLGAGSSLDERIAMTVERGRAYARAGADLVFIPMLTDLAVLARLVDAIGAPISLMFLPGAPRADVLFASGAKRVSLGPFATQLAYDALSRAARQLRASADWGAIDPSPSTGFTEADMLDVD